MSVETQESIGKWADEAFGPAVSPVRIAGRANEEMAELIRVATSGSHPGSMVEEAADVVIVLMRMCHVLGWDLQKAIDAKMAINRTRQWQRDGTGHGYHVRHK